jgi:hypothetical protein
MQYLPPLLRPPPQTIISVPVQTAVCPDRAFGALTRLVDNQLSAVGSYLPPVFSCMPPPAYPPQIIISLPIQTALWRNRTVGALVVVVGVQLSRVGSYFPPVFE